MSKTILYKMSTPLSNTLSLTNSLWSCSRIGVLFKGVNPNAGMFFSRRNLLSVAAGKISVEVLMFKSLHELRNDFHHTFFVSSMLVSANSLLFSNSLHS